MKTLPIQHACRYFILHTFLFIHSFIHLFIYLFIYDVPSPSSGTNIRWNIEYKVTAESPIRLACILSFKRQSGSVLIVVFVDVVVAVGGLYIVHYASMKPKIK